MNKRVILAVTNDISGDQRIHKVAMSLISFGYEPVLVGRRLPSSVPVSRAYRCVRFKLPFIKGPLFYASFNIRLFIYLLLVKADTFLANDLDTLPAVFVAGNLRHKNIVYDSHEYFTEVPELVNRPKAKRVWELIEGWIFPKLKSVYTVNRTIAGIYSSKYGVPVRVVRNVPSLKYPPKVSGFIPESFNHKPIVIYQGALNMGRGLEEMIRAMVLMPDFRLLIAGDGDIKSELENLVNGFGIEDRIFFTGKIPFEQLSWYTGKASLGVSLEQNIGLNYYYSLPNKLFDYLHAGIPVVASDLPEIKQIVEKVGFGVVINQFDPISLSETIKEMLHNPDLMQVLHENAIKAAPDFTWENEEKELQKFFPMVL
jgi:glycosyltransferase involved in cell wall biosynthesis